MAAEISVSPDYVGDVLSDLTSKRRAIVREVCIYINYLLLPGVNMYVARCNLSVFIRRTCAMFITSHFTILCSLRLYVIR
jgi:hypothetical protein